MKGSSSVVPRNAIVPALLFSPAILRVERGLRSGEVFMTDEEYRAFLTALFEHYVRPRLPRARRRHHHHMMEEWGYHLDKAVKSGRIVRFIESQCADDGEMYRTFTTQRLLEAISDTQSSLGFARREIEEDGYLDAFEAHAPELLDGLAPHHLPEIDREVLRDMGSINPDADLAVLVLRAKRHRHRMERFSQDTSIRHELKAAEDRLAAVETEFDEIRKQQTTDTPKQPTKTRRWFKGLGQIAQGTALTIANAALALGVLKFPVAPETQTWGAVASVTTGIGTILSGIGDLRNE